jgi:hypothetical protein
VQLCGMLRSLLLQLATQLNNQRVISLQHKTPQQLGGARQHCCSNAWCFDGIAHCSNFCDVVHHMPLLFWQPSYTAR